MVPCSRAKLDRPAPAAELYVGSWHRLARRAGQRLVDDGRVDGLRILSALHGLVTLDQVVEPYDVTIDRKPAPELVELVGSQLAVADVQLVIALAPARYVETIRQTRMVSTWSPLTGCTGVGYQRQRLARIAAGGAL